MDGFPSIEEVHAMLDEIAEGLPSEFFKKLNTWTSIPYLEAL